MAKSIADKIDVGSILLPVKDEDLISLEPILRSGTFEKPNLKLSVYKNRRGKYKDILLWCKADRGQCKFIPLFATDYQYKLIELPDLIIKINPKIETSAF